MKPINLKLVSKAKGEARVKTLIRAHLYWLYGFPYRKGNHIYWCCPGAKSGAKQKIVITSTLISKAQRVIYELKRDYRTALPRVVGNVDVWEKRCNVYLERTKAVISNSQMLEVPAIINRDSATYQKLCYRFNESLLQSEFGIAVQWMCSIESNDLNEMLDFGRTYQLEDLDNAELNVLLMAKLAWIYLKTNRKNSVYFNLILNPKGFSLPTCNGSYYATPYAQYRFGAKKRKKQFSFVSRPANDSRKPIRLSVDRLLELSQSQLQRILGLLDAIGIDELYTQSIDWWEAVDYLVAKITNYIRYSNDNKIEYFRILQTSLEEYIKKYTELPDFLKLFCKLEEASCDRELTEILTRIMQSLTKLELDVSKRLSILNYFIESKDDCDKSLKFFKQYLMQFDNYLTTAQNEKALVFWDKFNWHYWGSFESKVFDDLDKKQIEKFFEVLSLLANDESRHVCKKWVEPVGACIAAGHSVTKTVELVTRLHAKNLFGDVSKIPLKIACERQFDLNDSIRLIRLWSKLDEEYTDDDTLKVLFNSFKSSGLVEVFDDFIFSDRFKEIRQCSDQVRIIMKVDKPSQVPQLINAVESFEPWIEQYPAEYHSYLAKLNQVSKTSERDAKRVFKKNWWPLSFLQEERANLEQQLANANLPHRGNIIKRMQNLEVRMANFKPATEVVSQKIKDGLTHLVKQKRFERWRSQLELAFKQSWSKFLGLEGQELPAWLFESETLRFLLPICDFKPSTKNLAKQIVRQRVNDENRTLFEHPNNRKFLSQLSDDGFNADCWVNGVGKRSYTAKSGQTITLNLATDSWQILNMGGHFNTCLSPGNFNYFSVFSNIADANKQVIYGVSNEGRVVGRVLVGLTSSGGIKVFHIYCHNADDEFSSNVIDYIQSWAKAGGFTLTEEGEIQNLVSTEWYDDGAIEVANTIDCFKDGSKLREKLHDLKPSKLERTLVEALCPLPINELTFPLLLGLPELQSRQDLLLETVNLAKKISRLSRSELIKLLDLTHQNNCGDQCFEVLGQKIIRSMTNDAKNGRWIEIGSLELICNYSPVDSLRVIKLMGKNKRYRWYENIYSETAKVAVKSLTMLGRHLQAEDLAKKYKLKV